MPEIPLFARGGASELTLQELLTAVHQVRDQLPTGETGGGTTGGTVALDAPTLAALEQVTATIANLPTDYPDADALAVLQQLLATINDGVTVTGNVVVANPTTTVAVSNLPATQPVSGTVTVANPTPAGLTNDQLRATPLPVSVANPVTSVTVGSGTVELGAASLAALEQTTVTVANPTTSVAVSNLPTTQAVTGTVALDATSLAALEQTTVTVANPTTSVAVSNLPATQAVTDGGGSLTVDGTVTAEDSGEREYVHVVATVSSGGDTVVHTPAAGKAIRLRWVYAVNDPTASAAPLIKISLGGQEKYRAWAISKRQRVTGPVNGALVVNLSAAGTVAVTALLEEV